MACVGAWHPAALKWTVARAGQMGFHHRTEVNKMIYRIGKVGQNSHTATTESDVTFKGINPLGGFPRYGNVINDYIIIRGSVPGPVRRLVTLRRRMRGRNLTRAQGGDSAEDDVEHINLKFIDTSSKFGHGRFQTSEEKAEVLASVGRLAALSV